MERGKSGRWTASLITSIKAWIQRNFGENCYFLTHFLSGHVYFRQYLHHMKKVTDPGCIYFEETSDDAEHTLFYYLKWQDERNRLIEQIGEFTPDNIVKVILESESKWSAVRRYVESRSWHSTMKWYMRGRANSMRLASIWRIQTWESGQWSLTRRRSEPFPK